MNELFITIIEDLALVSVFFFIILPLFIQSKVYYPSKQHFLADIDCEDIFIPTDDGININAWYFPPTGKDITILFCHGNGGNLSFYPEVIQLVHEKGYGILAFDYRGYGKSGGKPYEEGLYTDLRTAVQYLKDSRNTNEEKIVLWGISLGGAVAAQIASENGNFRGVILQNTFTSIKDMSSNVFHRIYIGMKSEYRNLPTHNLVRSIPVYQKFETKNKVHKIKSPLLIAHAVPDNIVPVEMSRELAAIKQDAQVFISQEGGHNEHDWFYPRLFEFLNSL